MKWFNGFTAEGEEIIINLDNITSIYPMDNQINFVGCGEPYIYLTNEYMLLLISALGFTSNVHNND